MNRKFLLSLIAAGLMTQNAYAETYVGGQIGYNSLDDVCADCDDESFAAGLFAGYAANENLGIELGVDWLGEYDQQSADGSLSAISLMPKFTLPLTEELDAFFKIGGSYVSFDGDGDLVPTFAIGADYQVTEQWKARLAYQHFNNITTDVFDNVDADAIWLGLSFNFGSVAPAVADPEPVQQKESEPVVVNTPVAEPAPEPEPVIEPTPAPVPQPAPEPVVVKQPEPEPEPVVVAEPTPETVALPEWITKQHKKAYDESLFKTGSAELSEDGKAALIPLMEVLVQYPGAKATIVGHTDSVGSEAFNQTLSEKRAQAVADFFVEGGVNADQLTVKGMGESQPIATNETAEGRSQNRRVEIDVPEFDYDVYEVKQ